MTSGPGKLTLLSYQSNVGVRNHIGAKTTDNICETRWLIGFSHTFERFAFVWEGEGRAVYRIGSNLLIKDVETSWTNASLVKWGLDAISNEDVSSEVGSALVRDNATTFWALPNVI